MYTIDDLRRIDDADLDAYQRSVMFHYWRVGRCWESLRTTAKNTGMSLGKAKQVRDWLLENDYIQWEPAPNGKMAIVIKCSPHEQIQQHERSQGEQCSCGEQECSCGERHLKKPIEEDIYNAREAQGDEPATDSALQPIITALAKVSKETFWEKTREDFDSAAHMLFGWDATPETIAKFAALWKDHGHYHGRPALKTILNEYRSWLAGTWPEKPNKNGRHPEPTADETAVWQTVLEHAARGDPDFESERIKAAVRATGWPALQRLDRYTETKLRKRFFEAYRHERQSAAATTA